MCGSIGEYIEGKGRNRNGSIREGARGTICQSHTWTVGGVACYTVTDELRIGTEGMI